MLAPVPSRLDLDEVLRCMGCPPEQADPVTREAAEQAASDILGVMEPRWTWRIFPLREQPEGVLLEGGLLLPGESIRSHLAGCSRGILFCATLGTGPDLLIRRAGTGSMLRTLALDCAASAGVEAVCDWIEETLQQQMPDMHFRWRFSPGYGDLPVSLQPEILRVLDAGRRTGLTATPSCILLPRKSVTAVLGLSDTPAPPPKRSCFSCPLREDCQYRKSGGHCGIS